MQTVKFFRAEDFKFDDDRSATCPAGKTLTGNGNTYGQRGHRFRRYEARSEDCTACRLRAQCLRTPSTQRGRQLARFERRQRDAADPSQRIATVEPVFANIRHHKRMSRFTLRGKAKVGTQWNLYCLVHNIEKMARYG